MNTNNSLIVHDLKGVKVIYSNSEIMNFIWNGRLDGKRFYDFLIKNNRFNHYIDVALFNEKISIFGLEGLVLNTGSSISLSEINNKQNAAKNFSEGNKELEELLNYVWSNHMETIGCCGGHRNTNDSENISMPYILFKTNNNFNDLIAVADKLIDKGYSVCYEVNNNVSNFRFGDDKFDLQKKTMLFKEIINALKEVKKDNFVHNTTTKFITFLQNGLGNPHVKMQDNLVKIDFSEQENEIECQLWPNFVVNNIIQENNIKIMQQGVIIEDGIVKIKGKNLQDISKKLDNILNVFLNSLAKKTKNVKLRSFNTTDSKYLYKVLSINELINLINYGFLSSLNDPFNITNQWIEMNKLTVYNNDILCELPKGKYSEDKIITLSDLSGIYFGKENSFENLLDEIKKIYCRCEVNGESLANIREIYQLVNEKFNARNEIARDNIEVTKEAISTDNENKRR